MAIHLPLSIEAQTEAYLLMLAPNNLMALTINEPIVLPSQDIVLGCHYLTILNNQNCHKNYYFIDFNAVMKALDQKIINLHSIIWVKYNGSIQFDKTSFFIKTYNLANNISIDLYTNYQIRRNNFDEITSNYILTTPGRIIINRLVSNILTI
jgi:DNA-directed RNA polymerase subunit beta'